MEDLLISILETMGYPVRRQGSLLPDEPYPDSFFTFWNDSADGNSFYDDDENSIIWTYSINFYTCDPSLTVAKVLEAKKLLKKGGFEVSGAGYDVASDEVTHTGRGFNAFYFQKI